ncbi:MAG: biotin--[acetyl-CoA-carboxylase] ligase [Verrucomicrobiae bacterium]|nr:biotin--[acetyl-CoA-carboxylase] ligase [Verrucomicrobiae bacterium]
MTPAPSTSQRILEELIRSDNDHSTGLQLAGRLKVMPGTIAPYVAELRKLGYEIESDPHLGYRLLRCPEVLLPDELKARLRVGSPTAEPVIGRDIIVYKQTDSTSNVIDRLALDGIAEGVVVFAETQTKGRGRRGRTWISPSGSGLWLSVLLRPNWPPQAVTRITILSAVALVEALREVTGIVAEIKWPNDVLVNGRKLAGILTEMETDSDQVRFVTLGIGVNVRHIDFPPELQNIATTVEDACDQPVRRADLAAALLLALDRLYAKTVAGEFEPIRRQWGEHSSTLGKRVAMQIGTQCVEGQAMALDENGSMLVRTDNGRIEHVIGGDVVLEK